MALKRQLMEGAVRENPEPEAFEAWLLQHCLAADIASGSVRAVAQDIFAEWRLASACRSFGAWLAQGAPSDDAQREG
jgi:hypothetical protein